MTDSNCMRNEVRSNPPEFPMRRFEEQLHWRPRKGIPRRFFRRPGKLGKHRFLCCKMALTGGIRNELVHRLLKRDHGCGVVAALSSWIRIAPPCGSRISTIDGIRFPIFELPRPSPIGRGILIVLPRRQNAPTAAATMFLRLTYIISSGSRMMLPRTGVHRSRIRMKKPYGRIRATISA